MATAFQYTILSGDTLYGIAQAINQSSGINYKNIESANPGMNSNVIHVGQELRIPAATGDSTWTYTVRPGDSLSKIAEGINKAAGVTYPKIELANPGLTPTSMRVGEVIDIPAAAETAPVAQAPVVAAANIGYWDWTWSPRTPLPGATMGIAFSGYADVSTGLTESNRVKSSLVGDKYFCIGGGGETTGAMTGTVLTNLNAAIAGGKLSGYDGIAYDVEVGDSDLATDFSDSFAAAKSAGLKVLVTVSHSVPYGISDGPALMDTFFASENIDFISPQLYTTGKETENEYTAYRVPWSAYAASKAKIIPSIVKAAYYESAVSYFAQQGVTLEGYIQWSKIV